MLSLIIFEGNTLRRESVQGVTSIYAAWLTRGQN